MAPPCTPFGALSQINRVHNREAWLESSESLAIGETIARFCSELAFTQLRHHRHFLLENPRGSELFKLPCIAALLATNKICKATFPQCSLGLLSPEGLPLLKFTTVWTSHPTLSKPFENLQCTHTVHGEIQGNYGGQERSKLAQIWLLEFCRRVAHAVAAPRSEFRPEKLKSAFPSQDDAPNAFQSAPNGAQTAPKTYLPETPPPGVNSEHPKRHQICGPRGSRSPGGPKWPPTCSKWYPNGAQNRSID